LVRRRRRRRVRSVLGVLEQRGDLGRRSALADRLLRHHPRLQDERPALDLVDRADLARAHAVAIDPGAGLAPAVVDRRLPVLEVERGVERIDRGVVEREVALAGADAVLPRDEHFSPDEQTVAHDHDLEDRGLSAHWVVSPYPSYTVPTISSRKLSRVLIIERVLSSLRS